MKAGLEAVMQNYYLVKACSFTLTKNPKLCQDSLLPTQNIKSQGHNFIQYLKIINLSHKVNGANAILIDCRAVNLKCSRIKAHKVPAGVKNKWCGLHCSDIMSTGCPRVAVYSIANVAEQYTGSTENIKAPNNYFKLLI